MALFYDPRTIAPFIYRNENYSGTLAIMGNDCSGTSTTCQVDSVRGGIPVRGSTGTFSCVMGTNITTPPNGATSFGISAGVGAANGTALGFLASTATVPEGISIGAGCTLNNANFPLGFQINASGLTAGAPGATTDKLGVWINNSQYYIPLTFVP